MASRSKSSPKRWRLLVSIALLLCLVVIVAFASLKFYHHYHSPTNTTASSGSSSPENTINYSPGTAGDNSANNARKGSPSSPASTLGNGGSSSQSTTQSFTVQITANASSSNVHVGTLVSGATQGSCSLTASKAGQPDLQLGTATVHQDVNYYDCGVFNVSPSQFPASGSWQLKLAVTNNNVAESGTATVTITK